MTGACIVGWAHTPFGKLEDPDVEALIARVAGAAIEDAGVAASEIDGVFVGLFNNGFSKQDFPSSMPMQALPELRFKPATRYENACASGSAAIHGARDFLAAGRGRFALVVGAEKMTATPGPQVGDALLGASYRREEGDIPPGSPAYSGGSPRHISSAMAISRMRWRRLQPRTTRMASIIHMRRCGAILAMNSAAMCPTRTLTWRRR